MVERIRALATLLGEAPLIGQRTDLHDIRSILVNPYPYRMFYRVDGPRDEVRVLRIRHVKRRPL